MKRLHAKKTASYRCHRLLRTESLERRELMAVLPINPQAGVLVSEVVHSAPSAEVASPKFDGLVQGTLNRPGPELKFEANNQVSIDWDRVGNATDPLTNIDIPDYQTMPYFEEMPELFEPIQEEQRRGLPPEVDPGKMPGGGIGPDGQEPPVTGERGSEIWCVQMGELRRYREQNRQSDISDDQGTWDAATVNKVSHWGFGGGGNPLIGHKDNKGSGDKDTGGKDTGDKSTGDKPDSEKPIEDDSSGKPVKTDSDPEGGGPDELLSPAAGNAALFDQAFSLQFQRDDGSGLPRRTTTESGGGDGLLNLPWHKRPLLGPREPGPDEVGSPAVTDAILSQFFGGENSYPTPDDPDGPGDPRSSDGLTFATSLVQQTMSPVDGGQGVKPLPPNPKLI
jgi:hypothetical protein